MIKSTESEVTLPPGFKFWLCRLPDKYLRIFVSFLICKNGFSTNTYLPHKVIVRIELNEIHKPFNIKQTVITIIIIYLKISLLGFFLILIPVFLILMH